MTTFQCPKCHRTTEALAKEAGHRCPSNRNKFVQFTVIQKAQATK